MSEMQEMATSFEQYLERCLSMVLHYDEVQEIADVVKKVQRENQPSTATSERGNNGRREN